MLLKLIGSICIIVSCTSIGFSRSIDLNKQLEELETLKHMFYLLKKELEYTHGTFEEIFSNIGSKITGKYGAWITELAETLRQKPQVQFEVIWQESIETDLKNTKIQEKDMKELVKIGKYLGRLESIELYINQLEYEIKIRREEYRSKRKLYQSMGIAGGIFLVILLL